MQIIVLRATGARNLQLSWMHIGISIVLVFSIGAALAWLIRPLWQDNLPAAVVATAQEDFSSSGMAALTTRLGQLQARVQQIDNLSARLGRALGIGGATPKKLEMAEQALPPPPPFKSMVKVVQSKAEGIEKINIEKVKAPEKVGVGPRKTPEKVIEPKKEEHKNIEETPEPLGTNEYLSSSATPLNPQQLSTVMNQMFEKISFQQNKLDQLENELSKRQLSALSWPSQKPVIEGSNTSTFGWRRDPFTGIRTFHEGLDLAAPSGHSILAAAPGKVIFAGMNSGYGLMAEIDHGRGIRTRYGHAQGFSVQAGDLVRAGQEIGKVGSTGRSTGSHLHFEVRINGVPQNPQRFIGVSSASLLAHSS